MLNTQYALNNEGKIDHTPKTRRLFGSTWTWQKSRVVEIADIVHDCIAEITSKGDGLLRSNLPLGDSLLRGAGYFVTVLCITILSYRGFQLPTIRVGWYFSAVMLFLLGFQLLTLRAGWSLSVVSLGVFSYQSVSHAL